jgi:RNA polymerase sigma-70 factor (ECF subfamily)
VNPELERRLVERAQRGDMTAWEQLYRAHKDTLYHRVIRPRTRNSADAEDVLVDTFTRGLERLGQFQWTGKSLLAWLTRIAINQAMDEGRRSTRHRRGLEIVASREHGREAVRPDRQIEAASDRQKARAEVEAVLPLLNPRYAHALRLRLLEDRPRAECAELLAVKLGTFDVLLLRATRAFRTEWSALYGERND